MELEPSKKYFKDDNWRRAMEITSPRPINNPIRTNKQDFTPEERGEILARVKQVGVLKAAIEFGMSKRLIVKWLKDMDRAAESQGTPTTTQDEESEEKLMPEPKVNEAKETRNEENSQDSSVISAPAQVKSRRAKDFTQEEAEKFLARVKEIGIGKASKEAGISTSVAMSLRRKSIVQSALKEKAKAVEVLSSAPKIKQRPLRRSRDFTTEEKLDIISKARVVGAAHVAEEYGISISMIYNWTFQLKNYQPNQVQPVQTTKAVEVPKPQIIEEPKQPKPEPVRVITFEPQSREESQELIIENMVLKEREKHLTEQIERLKTVVNKLVS